jgi:hypothetical protein
MRYEVAPLTLPQLKVGVSSLTVLPLEGEDRLGAPGADRIVTLQVEDHGPFPHSLEARTRQ